MTPQRFRRVAIIGGGSYGTFYARQLAAATARGHLRADRIEVVDRDPGCRVVRELPADPGRDLVVSEWGAFLDGFLDAPPPAAGPDDAIVPSPLMPHLMAEWLERLARRRWPARAVGFVPAATPLRTPYDTIGRDGQRYVSFADWLCPTHCVEPHVCPAIGAPRTWEMADALVEYTARLGRERPTAGPALFLTRHRAFGVGMFDAGEARAARTLLAGLDDHATVDLVVATVSSCHGAIGILRLGGAVSA
jgi:hypothetical protein